MAADLEVQLDETATLLQSSGGVFEVAYKGQLIYSKKSTGRFPEDGEVLKIVANMDMGMSLEEAQAEAAKGIPPLPNFFEWLSGYMARGGARSPK